MRVRIRFTKHGKVRFTSHRDTARVWERAFRKAGLAIAYSEGFSPRPKLHFGLALSTGHESDAEFLDADLAAAMDTEELAQLPSALTLCLPVGMAATAVGVVEAGSPSLQQAVTSCRWRIEVLDRDQRALEASVADVLAAAALPITRQRKGKDTTDDIRPQVIDLQVGPATDRGAELLAELGTQPRALRPSELLGALDPSAEEGLVIRTHQWIEHDGARREPLEEPPHDHRASTPPPGLAAAVGASHAVARAS
jgi:radical SAM-linked protein